MTKYKVSYGVLSEQGKELKAIGKLMDQYTQQVVQITGKLGQDQTFSLIKQNLIKLSQQLGESRAIINLAGEVLSQNVEGYATLETRQVNKIDSLKAHNQDFYKKPVIVASVVGAVSGVTTAGATPTGAPMGAGATTINYTENNTYINAAPESSTQITSPTPSTLSSSTLPHSSLDAVDSIMVQPPLTSETSTSATKGIAAGAAVLGAVAGAGLTHVVGQTKKRRSRSEGTDGVVENEIEEDPEIELTRAIERVKNLRDNVE
jgi:hypothetical protein